MTTTVALLGSFLLAGCGGGGTSDAPTLAQVKGKVIVNGNPLPNAEVHFAPETGGASTGKTGDDGSFTLVYRDGTPGAVIGTHRVTVTAGGPTPEQQAALDAIAQGDRTVTPPGKIAPSKTYTSTVQINEGENDIPIDLGPQ